MNSVAGSVYMNGVMLALLVSGGLSCVPRLVDMRAYSLSKEAPISSCIAFGSMGKVTMVPATVSNMSEVSSMRARPQAGHTDGKVGLLG